MISKNNYKKVKISKTENGIRFDIKVIPNSSISKIIEVIDGVIKIKLNSPPIEGKANKEVVKLLSKDLKVPKSFINIVSGDKNKNKSVEILGNFDELLEKIEKTSYNW